LPKVLADVSVIECLIICVIGINDTTT